MLEEGNEIDEMSLLGYCHQVAYGMVYLSRKRFVHRDLAARNILVSDQGKCKVRVFFKVDVILTAMISVIYTQFK